MRLSTLILYLHLVVTKLYLSSVPTCATSAHRAIQTSGRKTRKPCGFFVWDSMSASRYHICERLLRGSVYEGLGGKKFIRMKQRSVLANLYPLSRHGPSRCLLCGQSFQSHLMSWWFSRRYTPYDLYLDDVKKRGGTYESHLNAKPAATRYGRKKDSSNNNIVEPPPNALAYHRLYIKAIGSPTPSSIMKTNKVDTRRKQKNKNGTSSDLNPSDSCETRESGGIRYTVPKMKTNNLSLFQSAILRVARQIVLKNLDDLMCMQRLENNFNEWKERFNPDLIMR